MSLSLKDFEIMAPVGSRESLAAAIQAGADSIYFGIEGLNMRSRSSNNFTTDDLRKIVALCREHGIKSYLTVNTVIYGEDLPLMREIIDAAKEAEVSAIIAADGSYELCQQHRTGGASFHTAQHFQCGSTEILCPFCRCCRLGA
jgi:putative protease